MEKLKEWTGSGIVGGAAFAAFTMVVSWLTGSWAVVWSFAKLHFWESLSCALVALGAGVIVGLVIRGRIDKKKLAAKDAEIAKLEKRPTQDEVDGLKIQLAAKDAKIAELKKRPTQSDLNELKVQLRAKDAEIEALKNAKMPTRLDIAKTTLGDDSLKAFRTLCAASTYVDGVPSRPLVFSMNNEKLSIIGLDSRSLLLMEEAGVIRLSEEDERDLVGTNARKEPTDIGYGVTACADFVRFDLAGGKSVEVKPVRLTWGTDIYIATGLYGADLGIASFTSLGAELAAEYAALNPPLGIVDYIEDAYSAKLRESRHHFRSLKEDGRE